MSESKRDSDWLPGQIVGPLEMPRVCPQCSFVKAPRTAECPSCGHVVKAHAKPHPKDIVDEDFDELPWGGSWKYHSSEAAAPTRWLIKGILPETGVALIAGQWGTFKTTIMLDASVSVMAGLLFAGRYRIKRRGAVLFLALEGEAMLSARLSAIAEHHRVAGALPFAWRGNCPALTNSDAADILCDLAQEAAVTLHADFKLPIVLIVVDTMITAAQYEEGGDNDTATTQKVMRTLRRLSERTNTLVAGIDHFGKVIETGTRGSSAKEGAADAILALLGDRELSGSVKNTRLAVRKQRDGISGFELPFTAKTITIDHDEDGDAITANIIDWQADESINTGKKDARWTKGMQTLRRVLMTTLADHGRDMAPFSDGLSVRACDVELVRAEFYRQHVAEGTDEQKKAARQKAFKRAVNDATARGIVATREVEGVQFVWLTKPEA